VTPSWARNGPTSRLGRRAALSKCTNISTMILSSFLELQDVRNCDPQSLHFPGSPPALGDRGNPLGRVGRCATFRYGSLVPSRSPRSRHFWVNSGMWQPISPSSSSSIPVCVWEPTGFRLRSFSGWLEIPSVSRLRILAIRRFHPGDGAIEYCFTSQRRQHCLNRRPPRYAP
jgi:hypothetical protein